MNFLSISTTIQDLLFDWLLSNLPMTAFGITIVWILLRLTIQLTEYRVRFLKTELDVSELKEDVKLLKKDMSDVKFALAELIGFIKGKKWKR